MRQEFFTNTIQSKFIKNLIYSTPLPSYETVNNGDLLIAGFLYIYKYEIIRCIKTGYLHSEENACHYEHVRNFNFGTMYTQFTERYKSNNIYYDSQTHEWLGKYLRCYRDIYGVDMMPFYNCVSNNYISGYTLHRDYISSNSSQVYKVLKIPISFNRKYTIALDSSNTILVSPIFLDKNNNQVTANGVNLNKYFESDIQSYNSVSFKQPVVWGIDLLKYPDYELMYKYKNDLYLLLQTEYKNSSSIVVLEGDYTSTNSKKVISFDSLDDISENELNSKLLYNLSLLQINENKIYPFADTLIEYLLWNAITSNDLIDDNFTYIKDLLPVSYQDEALKNGIYTVQLRKKLFDCIMNDTRYRKWDVNGFLTKTSEDMLINR